MKIMINVVTFGPLV